MDDFYNLDFAESMFKNKDKFKGFLKSKLKTTKLSLGYIKNNLHYYYNFNSITCVLIEYQILDHHIMRSIAEHYFNIFRQKNNVKNMETYSKIVNLIVFHHSVDDTFIRKHFDIIDGERLLRYQEISNDIIYEYFNSLNKDMLVQTQTLSEDFLLDNFNVLDRYLISSHQPLSEKFIENNLDKVELSLIGGFFQLSEDFIWKYRNNLSLDNMAKYQNLSCDLLDRLLSDDKKLNMKNISWRQDLAGWFIKKYLYLWEKDSTAIEELVIYQNLSEEIMNLLIKKNMLSDSSWKYLSRNQKISGDFFKRHRNKIYKCENSVDSLRKYQRVKEISKKVNIDSKIEIDIFKFL
jgi:hypothetical protein